MNIRMKASADAKGEVTLTFDPDPKHWLFPKMSPALFEAVLGQYLSAAQITDLDKIEGLVSKFVQELVEDGQIEPRGP